MDMACEVWGLGRDPIETVASYAREWRSGTATICRLFCDPGSKDTVVTGRPTSSSLPPFVVTMGR